MPKTTTYKKTIYTDDDIASILGVDRSTITLVKSPDSNRWNLIVEWVVALTDDPTESNSTL